MKKLKIVAVVGTRPEIIRLSRVLAALDAHCDHVLVHTGQNYDYELNQVFFDDLGVRKPDFFLNSAEGSTGAANTIGNLITAVDARRKRSTAVEAFEAWSQKAAASALPDAAHLTDEDVVDMVKALR